MTVILIIAASNIRCQIYVKLAGLKIRQIGKQFSGVELVSSNCEWSIGKYAIKPQNFSIERWGAAFRFVIRWAYSNN